MQVDRVTLFPTQLKIFASEKLLDGEVGGDFNQVCKGQLRKPFCIVTDDGFFPVEDFVGLFGVCACVLFHFFRCESRAEFVFVGGITDQ